MSSHLRSLVEHGQLYLVNSGADLVMYAYVDNIDFFHNSGLVIYLSKN